MQLSSVIESATSIWKLRLVAESDLCVSAPGKNALLWRACSVSAQAHPFISGSQLKGLVRMRAEQLAELGGALPCRGPRKTCDRVVKELCPVCKLFGGRGFSSPLVFDDLKIAGALPVTTFIRQVSEVDRKSRKSKDARLLEVVPAGAVFEGRIEARRQLTAGEERLLRRALAFVTQAGSCKTAGFGRVRIEVEETKA